MSKAKVEGVNREAWLRAVYTAIRQTLLPEAPEMVAVTWGFPSKKALSTRNQRIGECWSGNAGGCEGKKAILISPVIKTGIEVADVLSHEMIHAALPAKVGHKGEFVRLMKRIGLEGKPTATHAGPVLKAKLEEIIAKVGTWPAGYLTPPPPKDRNRQMKAECDCGRILRVSRKVYSEGSILCGECDSEFKMQEA